MPNRLVGVLVVLAVAVAGCGDDRDGDGGADVDADATTTTTTTAAAGATSTTGGQGASAADQAKAEEIVLRRSDFPAGWTSSPAEEADDASGEEFEACLGVDVDDDNRPSADSPDYSKGPLTQVQSSADIAPSVAVVDTEFAALQSDKVLACTQQQFDKEAAKQDGDVAFAPSRAERLDFPTLGDGTVAIRVTTSVTAQGQEVPIFADVVLVRKGRAELTLSFVNAGEPFPAALAADLSRKMVARA